MLINPAPTRSNNLRLFIFDRLKKLNCLIDTGADISVIPRNEFTNFKKDKDSYLTAANGSIISTYGKKILNVSLNFRRVLPFVFHQFIQG